MAILLCQPAGPLSSISNMSRYNARYDIFVEKLPPFLFDFSDAYRLFSMKIMEAQ